MPLITSCISTQIVKIWKTVWKWMKCGRNMYLQKGINKRQPRQTGCKEEELRLKGKKWFVWICNWTVRICPLDFKASSFSLYDTMFLLSPSLKSIFPLIGPWIQLISKLHRSYPSNKLVQLTFSPVCAHGCGYRWGFITDLVSSNNLSANVHTSSLCSRQSILHTLTKLILGAQHS